jgi:hypothetical protein
VLKLDDPMWALRFHCELFYRPQMAVGGGPGV